VVVAGALTINNNERMRSRERNGEERRKWKKRKRKGRIRAAECGRRAIFKGETVQLSGQPQTGRDRDGTVRPGQDRAAYRTIYR
jgi:hypothetical protein